MFCCNASMNLTPIIVIAMSCMPLLTCMERQAMAEDPVVEPRADVAVSQAAMAYQLAIQGQRTKSSVLMLAAMEIIGPLKTAKAPADLEKESRDASDGEKAMVSFDVVDWQEKAREYAKDDKIQLAFIEDRIEKLNSRGIVNLPPGAGSVNIGTTRYVILDSGVLGQGETTSLGNIQVRAREYACVGVVGDVSSELTVAVVDDAGHVEGGESIRGFGMFGWTPKRNHAAQITVRNNGNPSAYLIIGH
jgi:hypothetical protein